MDNRSIPLLLEDESRFDWPEGRYEASVLVGINHARIAHTLSGAPALEQALARGVVEYAAELRAPKALFSRLERSSRREHKVRWEEDELDGDIWIVPGLLAVKEFGLANAGLGELWRGDELRIPRGWWLAKGAKRRVSSLAASLLRFVLDDELEEGRMKAEPGRATGEIQFVVRVASDLWSSIHDDRNLQVAGLIGVCGHFPAVFRDDDEGEEGEEGIAKALREKLTDSGVKLWDEEDYDPTEAATAIERLVAVTPEE